MSFGIYNAFIFDRNYTMQEFYGDEILEMLKKETDYGQLTHD